MILTPTDECARRLALLRQGLADLGLEGAVLLQAVDVLWLSGTRQNAALWVPVDRDPVLLVRKSLERARAESPLAHVVRFPPTRELAGALGPARRLGITQDVVPVAVQNLWTKALPGVAWTDVSGLVRDLRSVKSPWEVERMRETARMLSGVFRENPDLPASGDAGGRPGRRGRGADAPRRKRGEPAGARLQPGVLHGARHRGRRRHRTELLRRPGHRPRPVSLVAAGRLRRRHRARRPGAARLHRHPRRLHHRHDPHRRVRTARRRSSSGRFDVARRIQDEVAAALSPGAVPSELFTQGPRAGRGGRLGDPSMGPPGRRRGSWGAGSASARRGARARSRVRRPPPYGADPRHRAQVRLPGGGRGRDRNTWVVGEGGGERLGELGDELLVVDA